MARKTIRKEIKLNSEFHYVGFDESLKEAWCKLQTKVCLFEKIEKARKKWDSMLTRDKDFAVISGNDSLILSALKEGGVGGIAGCANVYPHNMVAIYEKFKAGDLEGAQAAQDAIASFRACFKYGNPNTIVKTAVGLLGYPVGKCRKPFYSMSEEGVAALKAVLEENKRNGMN